MSMKMKASVAISSFFYIGFFPYSSGTLASIVTALIWFFFINLEVFPYLILILFITVAGTFVINKSLKHFQDSDPHAVVLDEVCGILITLIGAQHNFKNLLIGLVLFRFFDILKPLFIRRLEALPRGYGIMADDVLAGVYSMVLLSLFNYLGGSTWHLI